MAPFSVKKYLRDQRCPLPTVDKQDLSGRTVVVTGSNVGLGLEAARHFASMRPSKLILAVRTISKGEAARADILKSLSTSQGIESSFIEVWQLDMSNFESVKLLAKRAESLERLDIVLLNAGISSDFWNHTKDGYEAILQTNVIATGLLAMLLYPTVLRTAHLPAPSSLKPHITLTGSLVHFWTKFPQGKEAHPIQALNDKSKFNGEQQYNISKLLDLFIVREMGKRIESDKVVINTVNPGFCHSNLTDNTSRVRYHFFKLLKAAIARSTEMGSRTLVWACLNNTAPGAYSSNCTVEEPSDYSLSEEGLDAQAKVWSDLKEIWDAVAPETAHLSASSGYVLPPMSL